MGAVVMELWPGLVIVAVVVGLWPGPVTATWLRDFRWSCSDGPMAWNCDCCCVRLCLELRLQIPFAK